MLNDKIIKALEERGFKRWTKNGMDRLYINAETLGLDRETYKYRGERVSNTLAREMLAAKTYIDIETEKVFSGSWTLKTDAQAILDEVIEIVEAEQEQTEQKTDSDENSDDFSGMSDSELMDEKGVLNSRTGYDGIFTQMKRATTDEKRAELESELSHIKSRWVAVNNEIARRGLTRDIVLEDVNSTETATEAIAFLENEITDNRADVERYNEQGKTELAFRAWMEIIEYQSCIDAIRMRYTV